LPINYFSDEIAWAHTDLYPNQTHKFCFGEVARSAPEDDNVTYTMNSYGHRCEEFTKSHDGKHVLFAGCSTTFGEGLPYMKNWSGRLYNKIAKEEKLSGYFNLSYLGGNVQLIVDNIYKYAKKFGNPDYLFCHFPETLRYPKPYTKFGYTNFVDYNNVDVDPLRFINAYLAIRGLEMYCASNNINLYWNTWHEADAKAFTENGFLERYVYTTWAMVYAEATNNDEKNEKYFGIARDKIHPGYKYSDGIANILYERLKDEKNKNILV
jgi:hypothetical protein